MLESHRTDAPVTASPAANRYQASTSPEKLRGQYYTPAALVRLALVRLGLRSGDFLLDPACGDGEFLVGAVEHLARQGALRASEPAIRLAGFDVDPAAAAAALERARAALRRCGGDPDSVRVEERSALELPERAALAAALPGLEAASRLVVAGNPPYVEAKRLAAGDRAALRARFPGATTGAPDLYLYFLHVALGWLRGADRLGFVLPNKVLVNSNARALRLRLLEERRLAALDFATQAGVFDGAAVYPVVLYAAAAGAASRVDLAEIARAEGELARRELGTLPLEAYGATAGRVFFPLPPAPAAREALLALVAQIPAGRLDDVLDLRWSVSFHRAGLREQFVTPHRTASPHARPFVGGGAFSGNGEVERYRLRWAGWWIDYDAARLRALGNSLPDPALFGPPKVVVCQNGRTLRAAWDAGGHVLKDTFLCGVPHGKHPLARHPRALVGLLCSRAAHFCYAQLFFGGHVASGYLHFLRSFLADLPLGRWTAAAAAEVAALVERRAALQAEPGGEPSPEAEALEEAIEALVEEAYGLDAAVPGCPPGVRHPAAIRTWAAEDAGWQARARVRPPHVRAIEDES